MVVVRPTEEGGGPEEVATGYFLTGDLVLTARHVAERPGCSVSVRAAVGGAEGVRWSAAEPVWTGGGGTDAMVLRTERTFGVDWVPPTFPAPSTGGGWESRGYAKAAADVSAENRKTLPLTGTYAMSLGQGPAEMVLTTDQIIAAEREVYWKGVSGAPVFSTSGAERGLIGVVTDASGVMSNSLVALPTPRLLADIRFRSTITPSFLGALPTRPYCIVLTAEGSAGGLVGQVGDVLAGFREEDLRSGISTNIPSRSRSSMPSARSPTGPRRWAPWPTPTSSWPTSHASNRPSCCSSGSVPSSGEG